MRLLVQRVSKASVRVSGNEISKIKNGFLVFIGITHSDTKEVADYLVKKLVNLRLFEDENDKLNLSLSDVGGELLLVSQFTLYADCSKGNRPSFIKAAGGDFAKEMYDYFVSRCKELKTVVKEGIFGSNMEIDLVNYGPATVIMEKSST